MYSFNLLLAIVSLVTKIPFDIWCLPSSLPPYKYIHELNAMVKINKWINNEKGNYLSSIVTCFNDSLWWCLSAGYLWNCAYATLNMNLIVNSIIWWTFFYFEIYCSMRGGWKIMVFCVIKYSEWVFNLEQNKTFKSPIKVFCQY